MREQREQLQRAGCDPILADEQLIGATANRQRGKALRQLHDDAVLVVTSFDRLGNSLVDIIAVLQRLFEAGASLRVLDGDVDTGRDGTARAALVGLIEAQSRLVSERSKDGLATRKAQGKRVGPEFRLLPAQWPELKAMIAARASAAEMTAHFKVSRQTLWNFRRRMEAADVAQSAGSSEKK